MTHKLICYLTAIFCKLVFGRCKFMIFFHGKCCGLTLSSFRKIGLLKAICTEKYMEVAFLAAMLFTWLSLAAVLWNINLEWVCRSVRSESLMGILLLMHWICITVREPLFSLAINSCFLYSLIKVFLWLLKCVSWRVALIY